MATAEEKRSKQQKFCLPTNKSYVRVTFDPVDDDEFYYEVYLYGYRRKSIYLGSVEYNTLKDMAWDAESLIEEWIEDEGLDVNINIKYK